MTAVPDGQGIGASLPRKEDDRFLRGRSEFVADIRLPGMLEIAFLRSPLAHARIRKIEKPAEHDDRVFTHADLAGVAPIRAVAGLPGFKASEQPVLAAGKVRHVGEMIAMCVAETRAAAEDLAAEIVVDFRRAAGGLGHAGRAPTERVAGPRGMG
jgi:aerobic carbon-monoxide dehydrogenase large subunit